MVCRITWNTHINTNPWLGTTVIIQHFKHENECFVLTDLTNLRIHQTI